MLNRGTYTQRCSRLLRALCGLGLLSLSAAQGAGEKPAAFTLVAANAHATLRGDDYGGGTGTAEAPFQISTSGHLASLANQPEHWGSFFVLTADIDLSALPDSTMIRIGLPDLSLSGTGPAFTGTFDGAGFTVSHYTWNSTEELTTRQGVGLFGCLGVGGSVIDLDLTNVSISVDDGELVGSLVGANSGGHVSNCTASGSLSVNGRAEQVGGLVGGMDSGALHNCTARVDVVVLADGSEEIGGLIGDAEGGELVNCHAHGTVTTGDNAEEVGGLGGDVEARTHHCSASGPVSVGDACERVGGLVGGLEANTIADSFCTGTVTTGDSCTQVGSCLGAISHGTLERCYATSSVTTGTASVTAVGHLVGQADSASLLGCFLHDEATGPENAVGLEIGSVIDIVTLTATQFATQTPFENKSWDFTAVWQQGATPVLRDGVDLIAFAPAGRAAQPGQPITFSVRILNRGNLAAGNYSVNVFRAASPDAAWDEPTQTSLLMEGEVASHAASAWATCELSGVAPSEAGLHFLRARVDAADAIPEWSEDGNWSAVFAICVCTSKYSGGEGTAEAPYLLSSWDHVCALSWQEDDWDKHIALANDLQAETREATPFRGIGRRSPRINQDTPFSGQFGGAGHAIGGLTTDVFYTAEIEAGQTALFGLIGDTGRVSNLRLQHVDIQPTTGSGTASALANFNAGTIEHCEVSGSISIGPNGGGVGMLASDNYGQIIDCRATGTITAGEYCWGVGGLVGYNMGMIQDCAASCEITIGTGADEVGGLVGCNETSIVGCVAEGSLSVGTESDATGGLSGASYGPVSRCRAAVAVTAGQGSRSVGGLIGWNMGPVAECQAVGTVQAVTGSESIGGLIGGSDGGHIDLCSAAGSVSASGARNVGGLLGWHFRGDITSCRAVGDVTGSGMVGGFVGWQRGAAIGGESVALYLDDPTWIVGQGDSMADCTAECDVILVADGNGGGTAGGFAGGIEWTNVKHCAFKGSLNAINGGSQVGGFAGYHLDWDYEFVITGTPALERPYAIEQCWVDATIACTTPVQGLGGFVGRNWGVVSDCLVSARISGYGDTGATVGGVASLNFAGISGYYAPYQPGGILRRCLASWTLSMVNPTNVYAVAGSGGVRDACFWDLEALEGQSNQPTGLTSAQMASEDTFVTAGWDLTSMWRIHDGHPRPMAMLGPYRVDFDQEAVATGLMEDNTFQPGIRQISPRWYLGVEAASLPLPLLSVAFSAALPFDEATPLTGMQDATWQDVSIASREEAIFAATQSAQTMPVAFPMTITREWSPKTLEASGPVHVTVTLTPEDSSQWDDVSVSAWIEVGSRDGGDCSLREGSASAPFWNLGEDGTGSDEWDSPPGHAIAGRTYTIQMTLDVALPSGVAALDIVPRVEVDGALMSESGSENWVMDGGLATLEVSAPASSEVLGTVATQADVPAEAEGDYLLWRTMVLPGRATPTYETYTIAAEALGNGSVSPSETAADHGGAPTWLATPAPGYAVHRWFLDGNLAQTGLTQYVLADVDSTHTVSVTFAADSDDDGMPDIWETPHGDLAPEEDGDGDGIPNIVEFQHLLDPETANHDVTMLVLYPGWNLSLASGADSVHPEVTARVFFGSCAAGAVWAWNTRDQRFDDVSREACSGTRGYFVRTDALCGVRFGDVNGYVGALPLARTWNLIAVPWGGTTQPFDQLFGDRVNGPIWGWNAERQMYERITGVASSPGHACWAYGDHPCSIPLGLLISGTVRGDIRAGVTLTLSGDGDATTAAAADGDYSFRVAPGSYTITPSHDGYVFTNAMETVTVTNQDKTIPDVVAAPAGK